MIDVGCAGGCRAAAVKTHLKAKHGKDIRLVGIDECDPDIFDKCSTNYGSMHTPGNKCIDVFDRVVRGDVRNVMCESADLVTCFYLRNMHENDGILEACARLLKPGGMILTNVLSGHWSVINVDIDGKQEAMPHVGMDAVLMTMDEALKHAAAGDEKFRYGFPLGDI